MGFSVSASTAVIVVGLFLAFGMFFPAMSNSVQLVHDAESDRADRLLAQQNTDVELTGATFNESGEDRLVVNVTNTGSTTISVESIDLLVDNELQEIETDDDIETTIDDDDETTLFQPGETLTITIDDEQLDSDPERVLVAVDHGIRVADDVEHHDGTDNGGE